MDNSKPTTSVVYVGTYTNKGSKGIYRFELDRNDGMLTRQGLAAEVVNPSFLALAPNRRFLYCVSEVADADGRRSGAVSSLAINEKTYDLTLLDTEPSGGQGPCHLSVTADGNAVLVANYGSGSVALLPASDDDGGLGEPVSVGQHEGSSVNEKRQDGPHAHCILPDPSGRFAVAVDLGTDEIIAYRLSAESAQMDTSSTVVNRANPGSGPRHIAFHPNGRFAYTSGELDSTISAWQWSSTEGRLTHIQSVSSLPDDYADAASNTPAEILVSPDGRFVYMTNRGHNSIVVHRIDEETGQLELVGYVPTNGDHPRGMRLDPQGEFLIVANQDSDSLMVYRIDPETGLPEKVSEFQDISRPTHMIFL